ncbi:MAG: hypothetical protein B0D91_03675 [Oceanospirillales bacterium LUC14_002_19_P2]|nr:MAG: hypothetical protein B0D91_03675 [Oceanospirillales bacterium LUC14_002_19_P2]
MTTVKTDIYQEVTDRIIEVMEKGNLPWSREWDDKNSLFLDHYNASTGNRYRGINLLLLASAADDRGFTENKWLTFKQAKALGGSVRKGERGTRIVFWKFFEQEQEDAQESQSDDSKKNRMAFAKWFTVFNVQQCDGLDENGFVPAQNGEEYTDIDAFILATGAPIRHGGNKAYCSRATGHIQMPEREQFKSTDAYYATLLHELTHWSGHPPRLNREFGKRFGDEAYAFEELVAELGAAFSSAGFGIHYEQQHAAYLKSWLTVLKNDKRAIFTAASKAQQAADFLASFSLQTQQAA